MWNSNSQLGIFIPQVYPLIAMNINMLKALRVPARSCAITISYIQLKLILPKLLNLVKNVALLKFNNGNMMIAKNIGTVL